MSYTVADLKSDIQRKIHGGTLSKVNPLLLINEGAGNVLAQIDPSETIRTAQITNAVYDSVYEYALPVDVKNDGIIDLYPQSEREKGDLFKNQYPDRHARLKQNNTIAFDYKNGVKFLRINRSTESPKTIHKMDTISDNGSFSIGGDSSNLRVDSFNHIAGKAALALDLDDSGSSATLTNSTLDAVDLSDEEDEAAFFVWVNLPDASDFTGTGIELRWGSSASAYWSQTVTQGHNGELNDGWNLLRFDWVDASETSSPNASAIDYVQLTFNYNGDEQTVRVDNILAIVGEKMVVKYYSNYLFRDGSTNAWKGEADSDTDIVQLDRDARNLLLYECGEIAAQEIRGEDGTFDVDYFLTKLRREIGLEPGMYKNYRQKHKSQRMQESSAYWSYNR